MIWTTIVRASVIVSLGLTVKQIIDEYSNNIHANRIYNSSQAATFLGVERKEVVKLVKKKKITAKMVKGNYRIIGASILEYLNNK